MMEYRLGSRHSGQGSQINRAHSPFVALVVPWASIVLASLFPLLPLIASMPISPPMGFMMLLAWRLVRPGLLPIWAGFPLGLIDDLFSGQPFGCAILVWSLTLIALDVIETRFPWRGFLQDWLVASAAIASYILVCAFIAGSWNIGLPTILAPQLVLSILFYPLIGRLVAFLDRLRLRRFRTIG
ncbi:rod shape-determining protein MreD [Caenibius sp. WL]|nr:rod shape-determining protein MreD [Caenibius sp. WL]QZP07152.1 rod shape-determining protein MreD [Caenibius sp. WL]